MGRRIALLFHESDRDRDLSAYAVSRLIPVWREDGHEVVAVFGARTFVPADLAFVHVDLSEVPEEYLALAARYPASVNGRIRSIRKSVYSPHLLQEGDPWEGPVIVKSERNYGGSPEAQRMIPRLDGRGLEPPFSSPLHYPVLPGLDAVPKAVFGSTDYIVQRFLPELEEGLFHVRAYSFLGDWEECQRLASDQPIVKAETKVASAPAPVHPGIRALRQELGFDYGKIDYLLHGEELVVLDLNKTTGSRGSARPANPHRAATRAAKARGLYGLFPGAPQAEAGTSGPEVALRPKGR